LYYYVVLPVVYYRGTIMMYWSTTVVY
jgi:hypothetical protein